jgi:protein involved in polysaccharide export with SLBB domain
MMISNRHRIMAVFIAFLFVFSSSLPVLGDEIHASQTTEKSSPETVVDSADYPILRIGSGDLLSIFVYGENGVTGSGGTTGVMDQLPTDYQVDSDGIIVFPFLGRVKLFGLTPAQASEKIAGLLSKPRKVSVLIKYSSAFWVSVLGDVGHPGKFQITGRPTLLSVLADAGGPLTDADMGGAILIHNQVKTKINLDKYLKDTGAQMTDPYIYPGDTLMVQKSAWPSTAEWAIIASILASGAIIAVELSNIKN